MTQNELNAAVQQQQDILREREGWLKSTDYIAAKIAEGKATKAEYKDQIAQRQAWRDEINAALDALAELAKVEPVEEVEE